MDNLAVIIEAVKFHFPSSASVIVKVKLHVWFITITKLNTDSINFTVHFFNV